MCYGLSTAQLWNHEGRKHLEDDTSNGTEEFVSTQRPTGLLAQTIN